MMVKSNADAIDHEFDHRRVPPAVVLWLLLIAVTFVVGCGAIALSPSHGTTIVQTGVCINVAMAIGIGMVLTLKGIPHRLCGATWLGAVVTVIGWDLLSFTLGEVQGHADLGAIPFDVVAFPIAALGMTILLGVGAAMGGVGRLVGSRCSCGERLAKIGVLTL
jgi:hypothetical protein